MPDLKPEEIMRRLMAEFGYSEDRARMVAWGLAQSILTGWWSFEDHGRGYEPDIACAEILDAMEKSRGSIPT